jgi:hypothetical protein
MSRIKVTYVAMDVDGYKPIMTAESFEDLKKGLDDYYAVDRTDAECVGWFPYNPKYPDSYEGQYQYRWTHVIKNEKILELDVIKVYCVDFFPETRVN